jgi:hypothetical protein
VDDVIAVRVDLANGARRFFLTFGRIQDAVHPSAVCQLVHAHARGYALGGEPVSAMLCETLREAADTPDAPFFYEGFLSLGRTVIPFGEDLPDWRAQIAAEMHAGRHLYYCGTPDE